MIPTLLQQRPGGNWLLELLPIIIFVLAAVLPSIAQARRKAKESPPQPKRPAPPPPAGGHAGSDPGDLETRVRRYFEQLANPAAPPRREPPAAAPARPVHAPPVVIPPMHVPPVHRPIQRAPVHTARADVPLPRSAPDAAHAAYPLPGGRHEFRTRSLQSSRAGRDTLDSATTRHRGYARRSTTELLRGSSLRDAIVLREVLGPPKGLEDF